MRHGVAILCPLARMYPHSRASRDDSQPECQQYRPHSSNAGSTLTISIRVTRPRAGAEGQSFGAVGPFEHITGRAHGEVDPGLPENSAIQDILLAPRKAPANRDALTTLQLRDANTSSSSFRCRPTLFFIPASDCDAMLRPGRLYGIELPIALFDAAGPLVPGNRSADMVRASTFACSGDFLLRLAGCQGKDLIVEARRVAAAAS